MFKVRWCFLLSSLAAVAFSSMSMREYRLPQDVEPTNYKIKVLTYLSDNFTHNGEVWIDINVKSRTDHITLHSKELKIFENETKIISIADSQPLTKRDLRYANLRRLAMRERKQYLTTDEERSSTQTPPMVEFTTINTDAISESSTSIKEQNDISQTTASTTKMMEEITESISTMDEIKENINKQEEPMKTEMMEEEQVKTNDKFIKEEESNKEVDKLLDKKETEQNKLPETEMHYAVKELTTERMSSAMSDATTKEMALESTSSDKAVDVSSTSSTIISSTDVPLSSTEAIPVMMGYSVVSHDFDSEKDFLTVTFDKELQPGKYQLYFRYQGVLTDSLTGYHRVAYAKKNAKRATLTEGPLPAPRSHSTHDFSNTTLRTAKLTDPLPIPLCVTIQ